MTRSAIGDYFRQQQRQFAGGGGSTAQAALANVSAPDDEDGEAALAEETQLLYSRVVAFVKNEFSDQQWQAFYLVTVETQTAAEAARTLGMSRNQVYLAKSRVLKRLREVFGDVIADPVLG